MRVVSVINLKGGVAKTISSVNLAHILAYVHGYNVLLIDNDKQGNASKILNRHSASRIEGRPEEIKGTAEVMTERGINPDEVIQHTDYERLDIVAADMKLLSANLQVLLDQASPQQTRFRKFCKDLGDRYDFVVIDNAPDINISTINALVASDDVLIPVTIDEFAIDGLAELNEQVNNTREDLNPGLVLRGCFITQYDRYNEADVLGEQFLQKLPYPMFDTHIRRTPKMKLSTFAHKPIVDFSPRCGASIDYMAFVREYLQMVGVPFNAAPIQDKEEEVVLPEEKEPEEKEDNVIIDWSNRKTDIPEDEKEVLSSVARYMSVDISRVRRKSKNLCTVDNCHDVLISDAIDYCETHKKHEDEFMENWGIRRPRFVSGDGGSYEREEYYPGLDYVKKTMESSGNSSAHPKQDSPEQDNSEQDNPEQDSPEQDSPEQDEPGHPKADKPPHKKTPWRSFFE